MDTLEVASNDSHQQYIITYKSLAFAKDFAFCIGGKNLVLILKFRLD